MRALNREIYHLDSFTNDWAAWDDTYRFMQDRDPIYIESNLVDQTFVGNRLNLAPAPIWRPSRFAVK